jgi:peptide/nickel transport system substrate-binding protein
MRNRIWLIVGALCAGVGLMAASAPAAPKKAQGPQARVGGTVVIALDQEPRTLNGWITEGNLFATTEVTTPILDSGLRYNNRAQLNPLLFAAQPTVVRANPLTIRFRYKPAAKWSDGRQITGADFRFTWQTVMNQQWDITSRTGWEDIRSVAVRGKTVTVVFKTRYAAYRPLLGSAPLPRHALVGQNFNQAWRNGVVNHNAGDRPIGSGPFLFQRWTRGQEIVLTRNQRYWGRNAFLASMVYRPIPVTQTQFQALRAGEVHLLRPQPQIQIAEIARDRRFRVQRGPAYIWEHLDFQQGAQGHPALKRRYVRQALIRGINRRQIANALYRDTVPNMPDLHSVVYKNFEALYRPNWNIRANRFNQRAVIQILRSNGCTGGPARPTAGTDLVWTCPQVGRLSFRYTTNMGANQLRNLMFQIIQQQLRSVGIELRGVTIPSLTPFLQNRDWDIFNFAWVGSPTSPILQENLHGCGGDQNYMGYCNRAVTRLLQQAKSQLNDRRRNALLQRADQLMARDIPTVPMFAQPSFLLHRTALRGPLRNPTQASAFWNTSNWWLAA